MKRSEKKASTEFIISAKEPRLMSVSKKQILDLSRVLDESDLSIGDASAQKLLKIPCCAEHHRRLRYPAVRAKVRAQGNVHIACVKRHIALFVSCILLEISQRGFGVVNTRIMSSVCPVVTSHCFEYCEKSCCLLLGYFSCHKH